ncbi:hypothetical protein C8R46DRAFT_1304105 [Mycena filopes]|nr:hypothetical protein C8R46DRAFT_1304105 [Mycena filopes]
MSTPGSNRSKTPFTEGQRKHLTINTSAFSPEEHRKAARYQANFDTPFSPNNYDIGARPMGPLDVRMANFALMPEPRSPSRQQNPHSQPPAPGSYDGPGNVRPSPRHLLAPRMDNFPKDFGGGAQPPPNSLRSKPQSVFQTVPYPPSMSPMPGPPHSPTKFAEHHKFPNIFQNTNRFAGDDHHSRPPRSQVRGQEPMRIRDTLLMVEDIRV